MSSINRAAGATATNAILTDGNKTTFWDAGSGDDKFGQVDLGANYVISRVGLWMLTPRTYYDIRVFGSLDGTNWTLLKTAGDLTFTAAGHMINIDPFLGRYFRVYSSRNSSNNGNHFIEIELWDDGDTAVDRPDYRLVWDEDVGVGDTTGTTQLRAVESGSGWARHESPPSRTAGSWTETQYQIGGHVHEAWAASQTSFSIQLSYLAGAKRVRARNIRIEDGSGNIIEYDTDGYNPTYWDSSGHWFEDGLSTAEQLNVGTGLYDTKLAYATFNFDVPSQSGGTDTVDPTSTDNIVYVADGNTQTAIGDGDPLSDNNIVYVADSNTPAVNIDGDPLSDNNIVYVADGNTPAVNADGDPLSDNNIVYVADGNTPTILSTISAVFASGNSSLEGVASGPNNILGRALSHARFAGSGYMSGLPQDTAEDFRLILCDAFGVAETEFQNEAVFLGCVWSLNELSELTFELPGGHPNTRLAINQEKHKEIQFWYGSRLLLWGPITDVRVSPGEKVTITAKDARWYLTRRYTGQTEPENYTCNGGFEEGLKCWYKGYAYYSPVQKAPEWEIVTYPVAEGEQALRLTLDEPDADSYAYQTIIWEPDPEIDPEGTTFILSGKWYVETFNGPAFETRGLFFERMSTTEPNPRPELAALGLKKSLEYDFHPIDKYTRENEFHDWTKELIIPVKGEPESLNWRLYAIHGSVVYDEIVVRRKIVKQFRGVDQATIIAWLVDHAQDPAWGKDDFNLRVAAVTTRKLRDKDIDLDEAEQIWTLLTEFTELSQGVDYTIRYTGTTREIVVHYPQAGVEHPHLPLFADENGGNVDEWGVDPKWSDAANAIIYSGETVEGVRDQDSAVDTTNFSGNHIIQKVVQASAGTSPYLLGELAAAELAASVDPEQVWAVLPVERTKDVLGRVGLGDALPIRLESAEWLCEGWFRVIEMELLEDGRLRVSFNKRDVTEVVE